ncbi:MAG: hypothetical protein JWQ21_2927 [Herminiimonas sp.]|nr:hypothetical protein [Herminiimonas sp.]
MTVDELRAFLSTVAPDIDVLVGNQDHDTYFEPTISVSSNVHLWKLVQENPTGSPHYITYFADRAKGERETSASSLMMLAFYEVECLYI